MLHRSRHKQDAPAWPPAQTAGAVPESPFSPSVLLSTDAVPIQPGITRVYLGIVTATRRNTDGNPHVDQVLDLLKVEAMKRGANYVYGLRIEMASTAMGQMNTLAYGTAYSLIPDTDHAPVPPGYPPLEAEERRTP